LNPETRAKRWSDWRLIFIAERSGLLRRRERHCRHAEIRACWPCTPQTIQNLAKAGIIVKAGRGRYLLAPSVRAYVIHLRAQAAGRHGGDSSIDAVSEGALLKRKQRINYELKNAVLRSKMIPLEDIEPAWARIFRSARAAIMSIPEEARFRIPHLTASHAEILDEICRDQLEAAAFTEKPPQIGKAGVD
jgi:phage terminase Nu1 subunit (DNA packaging protein)